MKSIPTVYKGIEFRSRLEARYARTFDDHSIRWAYEVDAIDVGGRPYLPDFWLPGTKTYVEVKGPHKERADMVGMAQEQIDLGSVGFCDVERPLFTLANEFGQLWVGDHDHEASFCQCFKCRHWYFRVHFASWACRHCGYYNGNSTWLIDHDVIPITQMQWNKKSVDLTEWRSY